MNKVAQLVVNIKPFGVTAADVYNAALGMVSALNTPAPFETSLDEPNMNVVETYMRDKCTNATAARRKGMMVSSEFEVIQSNDCVHVYHLRNIKEKRLFLSIVRIQ